jgi:OOP family OmpA-OmpF porin
MKAHTLLFAILILCITHLNAIAQFNVLDKVKNKTFERGNQKVDQQIDKGLDKAEEGAEKKDSKEPEEKKESTKDTKSKPDQPATSAKSDVASYGKYDFVPGTKVIFEDDLTDETVGEFPSKWSLANGKIEVASLNGEKVIAFLEGNYASIYPYWKNKNDYLPDVFSIEFDHYVKTNQFMNIAVNLASSAAGAEFDAANIFSGDFMVGKDASIGPASGSYPGDQDDYVGKWHHIAIAYNKGNVKIYCDQYRLCIAPHLEGNPHSLYLGCIASNDEPVYIKNIRIAEGGGDLYKRVMSDGKFVSRGILFDVNKATLKPQSMGAINEVVQMMKDHADLKFEIDGHTDSDGDDAANMKLSQQRAEAVKSQIISAGIEPTRLSAKGFGKTKPVDGNDTSEGKANNRRVEFVKTS